MENTEIKRDYSFYSLLAGFLHLPALYAHNINQINIAINALDNKKIVYYNFAGSQWQEEWLKVESISCIDSIYKISVNKNRYNSGILTQCWWPFEFIIKD